MTAPHPSVAADTLFDRVVALLARVASAGAAPRGMDVHALHAWARDHHFRVRAMIAERMGSTYELTDKALDFEIRREEAAFLAATDRASFLRRQRTRIKRRLQLQIGHGPVGMLERLQAAQLVEEQRLAGSVSKPPPLRQAKGYYSPPASSPILVLFSDGRPPQVRPRTLIAPSLDPKTDRAWAAPPLTFDGQRWFMPATAWDETCRRSYAEPAELLDLARVRFASGFTFELWRELLDHPFREKKQNHDTTRAFGVFGDLVEYLLVRTHEAGEELLDVLGHPAPEIEREHGLPRGVSTAFSHLLDAALRLDLELQADVETTDDFMWTKPRRVIYKPLWALESTHKGETERQDPDGMNWLTTSANVDLRFKLFVEAFNHPAIEAYLKPLVGQVRSAWTCIRNEVRTAGDGPLKRAIPTTAEVFTAFGLAPKGPADMVGGLFAPRSAPKPQPVELGPDDLAAWKGRQPKRTSKDPGTGGTFVLGNRKLRIQPDSNDRFSDYRITALESGVERHNTRYTRPGQVVTFGLQWLHEGKLPYEKKKPAKSARATIEERGLAADDRVWECQRCGSVNLDGPVLHKAMGALDCPAGLREWQQKRFGDLGSYAKGNLRKQMSPCDAEVPGHPGRTCVIFRGHRGPHKGSVPPVGRQRKPRDVYWWEGSTELHKRRPTKPPPANQRAQRKWERLKRGEKVQVSHEDLDLIEPLDTEGRLRTVPDPSQVGTIPALVAELAPVPGAGAHPVGTILAGEKNNGWTYYVVGADSDDYPPNINALPQDAPEGLRLVWRGDGSLLSVNDNLELIKAWHRENPARGVIAQPWPESEYKRAKSRLQRVSREIEQGADLTDYDAALRLRRRIEGAENLLVHFTGEHRHDARFTALEAEAKRLHGLVTTEPDRQRRGRLREQEARLDALEGGGAAPVDDSAERAYRRELDAMRGQGRVQRSGPLHLPWHQDKGVFPHRLGRWDRVPLQASEWELPYPDDQDLKTEATRRKANVAAVQLLQRIQAEGRKTATHSERIILQKFSGWGGVNIDKVPKELLPEDRSGILYQYFTPTDYCSAVWALIARLRKERVVHEDPSVLEPSVGIGRFVASAPRNMAWTCVELHDDVFDLFSLVHGEVEAFHGPLEGFVMTHPKRQFDLVVANPPYTGRGGFVVIDGRNRGIKTLDSKGRRWSEAADYFMSATARMLAPNGLMMHLVPLGFLTGSDSRLRRELALSCDFLGAYLPPATMFPGARLDLCMPLFRKRAEPRTEVADFDEDFVHGRVLDNPAKYAITVGGRFAPRTRGRWSKKGEERLEVVGDFDAKTLAQMPLLLDRLRQDPGFRPSRVDRGAYGLTERQITLGRKACDRGVPAAARQRALDELQDAGIKPSDARLAKACGRPLDETASKPKAKSAKSTSTKGGTRKPAAPKGGQDKAVLAQANSLGRRFIAYRDLVRTDPALASAGRAELLADVQRWVQAHGNPHAHPLLKKRAQVREVAALLGAVAKGGGAYASILTSDAADHAIAGYPGSPGDLEGVIRFLTDRHGVARGEEVAKLYAGRDAVAALQRIGPGSVAVHKSGSDWRRWTFWSWQGYPYGDLYGKLRALKESIPPSWMQPFYEAQRRELMDAIDPQPIESIRLDPRSGLIPVGALGDWLSSISRSNLSAEWVDGLLNVTGKHSGLVKDVVAFLNRQTEYEDRDNKGRVKKTRRQKGELDERMAEDEALIGRFNAWARESEKWREILQKAYNEGQRGHRQRPFSTEQVPLLRMGENIRLRPHQNSAVRRVTATRGGLIAHDVGLGKTFEALTAAAYWRQLGIASKPLIVVPKQVLVNWLDEAEVLLPGYNIGTIGVTRDAKGTREDSAKVKAAKWQLYANGAWDITITTHPIFRQIPVKPETELRLYKENKWLQREEALAAAEAEYQVRRYDSMKKEVTDTEEDLVAAQADLDTAKEFKRKVDAGEAYFPRWRKHELQQRVTKAQEKLKKVTERLKKKKAAAANQKARVEGEGKASNRKIEAARQKHEAWVANRQFVHQAGHAFWEDLGCDALFIDEFHNFKNLLSPESRYGKVPKFLGRGKDDTKQCWDLWLKTMHLREQQDGTGVVGLTATPLKNSPIELFNLFQYVRPELFERMGLRNHEEFIDQFIAITTGFALTANGDVESVPQVSGYTNLQVLRTALDLGMDYATAEDVGLPLPQARPHMHVVPMSAAQQAEYAELRALGKKASRGGGKVKVKVNGKEKEIHYLAILDKMRKAALDLRLLGKPDGLPAKYAACVNKIRKAPGCAHIVFVDSVAAHDWVVDAMVAGGIPRNRIGRIYGKVKAPDRQKIAKKLNGVWEYRDGVAVQTAPAQLDVVLGNSQTMAEGLNLQRRACAIHHLELPWEPATLQQRNGRGVRQGNTNDVVDLHYYLSERSLDGYRLQLIDGKRNWMVDLLRGADNETNNPMADDMGAADFKVMFAANPEEAKQAMADAKQQALDEALKRKQKRALKLFAEYVTAYQGSRRQKDPDMRERMLDNAARLRETLERAPAEVFPYRGLLDKAQQVVIHIDPTSGAVYMEGAAICVERGTERATAWVESVDLGRQSVRFRKFGRWLAAPQAFKTLGSYKVLPECKWDPAKDAETRWSVWNDKMDHGVPVSKVQHVPEHLYAQPGQWEKLWSLGIANRDPIAEGNSWGRGKTIEWKGRVPFDVGGRLELASFRSYYDSPGRNRTDVPLPPSEAGWQRFVQIVDTATSRAEATLAARHYFGRKLPAKEA